MLKLRVVHSQRLRCALLNESEKRKIVGGGAALLLLALTFSTNFLHWGRFNELNLRFNFELFWVRGL